MNNNNRQIGVEGVGMETKYVRERRPTPKAFEDAGLSPAPTEPPIYSISNNNTNNTDDILTYNNFTNSSLLGGNFTNTTGGGAPEYDTGAMVWTMICPILMMAFCVFGQRSNVPSSQYHRGAMIRRQAERVWAIQAAKNEREAIPTETRKLQIEESLRRMKVVSKCPKTGHCVLGEIETTEPEENKDDNSEDDTNEVQSTATAEAEKETPPPAATDESSVATEEETLPPPTPNREASKSSCNKCPESPGTRERRPLLSPDSEDSEDNFGTEETTETNHSSTDAHNHHSAFEYDFEDDEDVCPICLDTFEVGDIVMFARHGQGGCSHVFHEECLQQWLLEQRENECPTCRACFIDTTSADANSTTSTPTADTVENNSIIDETENSIVAVNETENNNFSEEETTGNESDGDIEEGNLASSNNANDNGTSGGECSFDLDEMGDGNNQVGDGEDETESPNTAADAAIDDMEEGFSYIIVKGSVQRVPL